MKPVFQTRTGQLDGNCFAACIASILEIPLESIPDLGDESVWVENTARFLNQFGLYYTQVSVGDPILRTMFGVGEMYHTVEGTSPRGGQHACVGLNGRIVHDPHPFDDTGRGLVKVSSYGVFGKRFDGQLPSKRLHRALDHILDRAAA